MSTYNIPIFNVKDNHPNYPKSAAGTQERVRNNRGKRAISARATECLLYVYMG